MATKSLNTSLGSCTQDPPRERSFATSPVHESNVGITAKAERVYFKLISDDAVCRVSALGIDSNIFASNYHKPKAWTHAGDHTAVATVSFSAVPTLSIRCCCCLIFSACG